MQLRGKVALVTGGIRGLGWHIASAFAANGATVLCAGRKPPSEDEPLPDGAAFHPVDVRSAESVQSLVNEAVERFGALDVVVANAGASSPGPVATQDPAQWQEVFETNVAGTLHTLQAATPALAAASGQGRFITMSSALAGHVAPGAGAYSASKAAIETMTKIAAVELAQQNITVNCLSPGIIDEGMGRALIGNEMVWSIYRPKLAAGRPGRPQEVADAAVFLASDAATYVSGHVLEVNGGLNW